MVSDALGRAAGRGPGRGLVHRHRHRVAVLAVDVDAEIPARLAARLHGAQDARMVVAVCATIGVAILALGAELIGLPLPVWP